MRVLKEQLTLDATDYELQVIDEQIGGFYCSYFCSSCWIGGVKYQLYSTVAEAQSVAEFHAKLHHVRNHHSTVGERGPRKVGGAVRPYHVLP